MEYHAVVKENIQSKYMDWLKASQKVSKIVMKHFVNYDSHFGKNYMCTHRKFFKDILFEHNTKH